jgi:ParB-like chromosome segregation protein Spo0J
VSNPDDFDPESTTAAQVPAAKAARKGRKPAPEKHNVVLGELDVIYLPVNDVKANSYNPNRQSEHDFELLCKSIAEDGFTQPIVVMRSTKEIVDGEHRWRACKHLGFAEVPVVLVDMTPEQMRISTLRHNRARGSEDVNLAADVIRELAAAGATDYAMESLSLDELDMKRMLEVTTSEAADVIADVPPEMMGPRGHGLSAQDGQTNIDTTADTLRAREQMVVQAKAAEEKAMTTADSRTYSLVMHFTGEESDIIRKVLHPATAQNILKICQEEKDAGRAM